MKADIKAAWLAALRDPAAKQTQNTLARVVGFDAASREPVIARCCLGVLACTLAAQFPDALGDWGYRETTDQTVGGYVGLFFRDGTVGSSGSIPVALGDQIRFDVGDQEILIDLNDKDFQSFGMIADWIEANVVAE